jgi:hypothetical protein
MAKWIRWQDWGCVGLGVLLFIAPFVFGVDLSAAPAWTAYVGGTLLLIVGLVNLSSPAMDGGLWTEGILGVLVFISPWVLGFSDLMLMAWSAWIIGVLAVVLPASVLYAHRDQQTVPVHR